MNARVRRYWGAFLLGPWPDKPAEVSLLTVGTVVVTLPDEFEWSEYGTVRSVEVRSVEGW